MELERFTAAEKQTIAYYDQHGREWSDYASTPWYWGTIYESYLKLLPQGQILEIGTGGGRDARELRKMGYDHVGVDISQGLLQVARENQPNLALSQQSVYELAFAANSFDGFWCAATLLHLPKSRVPEALGEIRRVTKRNGPGFIALKFGEGEKVEADGRFFAYYDLMEFWRLAEQSQFKVVEAQAWPKSPTTTWLLYLLQTKK